MANFGVPYGREESCKISPASVERDRFLLTVAKSTLGASPHDVLLDALDRLEMPAHLLAPSRRAMSEASMIHFGHEATSDGPIAKVYFEYGPLPVIASQAPPITLYLSFKWRPGTQKCDETHYILLPPRDPSAVLERVVRDFGADIPPVVCLARLLAHPAVQSAGGELMLLDVVDRTSARRSFDVNLYRAALPIGRTGTLLDELGRQFVLAIEDVDRLAAAFSAKILGHVAGGVDRAGSPFVTLYFGVEEQR